MIGCPFLDPGSSFARFCNHFPDMSTLVGCLVRARRVPSRDLADGQPFFLRFGVPVRERREGQSKQPNPLAAFSPGRAPPRPARCRAAGHGAEAAFSVADDAEPPGQRVRAAVSGTNRLIREAEI